MSFGEWAISHELYDWLVANIPAGKTILELGSGAGTEELVKRWKVYSVEHDEGYLGKVPEAHYIHSPIVNGWYDTRFAMTIACQPSRRDPRSDTLTAEDVRKYDVLIIDGPPSAQGRHNFIHHMDLFHTKVPWVFDDMHRMSDLRAAAKVASARGSKIQLHHCADGKEFGVIAADKD